MRRFITNVHKTFYCGKGDNCLRCVPVVSLELLFSLRIGEHDSFTPAVFGYVLARDVSKSHTKMSTVKSCSLDNEARTARKDLCFTVEKSEEILRIVLGIVDVSLMMQAR